jgi:tagaturonate epimerase
MSDTITSLGLDVAASSIVASGEVTWGLARLEDGPRLVVLAPRGAGFLARLEGEASEREGATLLVGPTSLRNGAALRERFPWLVPSLVGTATSVGLGDRLGLATPGHVRAMRSAGGAFRPVFAQQSIREMARTGRTPQQVMDDAMWGVFAEGWRRPFGADADHLKEFRDIDRTLLAGFTMFTIDPGAHVDASAEKVLPAELGRAVESLPWADLEDTSGALRRRYLGRHFDCDGTKVSFDEEALARAAVKYARAVAHVAKMYRHLEAASGRPFEVEVSVDETEQPTSHADHFYVAKELGRLGVRWTGLAPRFVGRFEKGVDYIGDRGAFERHFAGHAAIARALGPYKISLHSGSDKFSIYPIAAELARGLVHLKTAGTSYLEALRTAAAIDPPFFRDLYAFARTRYEADRASYHVSARLDSTPEPSAVPDADLVGLLDDFHARQVLHVTFGSVLSGPDATGGPRLGARLLALIGRHPEGYAANLERHIARHLAPFARTGS